MEPVDPNKVVFALTMISFWSPIPAITARDTRHAAGAKQLLPEGFLSIE